MPPETLAERTEVLDPLTLYVRDAAADELLTGEQERALAERMRGLDAADAKAARQAFLRANLRLVINVARRFRWGGMSMQDKIQEGNMALLRAVDGFDPTLQNRF